MRPKLHPARQGVPLAAILAVATSLPLSACSGEGTDLTGSRAWVTTPSAEGVSTCGVTVRNRTDEARTLRHVMATDFLRAELRASVGEESTSPPHIIVEANASTELPPNGATFLLKGPKRSLHVGDETLLALHFDDGQAIFISAKVGVAPPSSLVPRP